MLLPALVWRVLGVFHLVVEFEKCIFYVVEARWWGFAVARGADWRHFFFSDTVLASVDEYEQFLSLL